MSAASATLAGRTAALARMLDTCTVRRVTGLAIDDDGASVPAYSAPLYVGACRVQAADGQESTPAVADGTVTVQRYSVHIPVGAYAPAVGDRVVVDAAALDPALVGREYRVVALLHKSQATAYRLGVEEVV